MTMTSRMAPQLGFVGGAQAAGSANPLLCLNTGVRWVKGWGLAWRQGQQTGPSGLRGAWSGPCCEGGEQQLVR